MNSGGTPVMGQYSTVWGAGSSPDCSAILCFGNPHVRSIGKLAEWIDSAELHGSSRQRNWLACSMELGWHLEPTMQVTAVLPRANDTKPLAHSEHRKLAD